MPKSSPRWLQDVKIPPKPTPNLSKTWGSRTLSRDGATWDQNNIVAVLTGEGAGGVSANAVSIRPPPGEGVLEEVRPSRPTRRRSLKWGSRGHRPPPIPWDITLQDAPKTLQDAPKTLQDAPKTLQDAPKTPSRHLKTIFEAKNLPERAPGRQNTSKTFPKTSQNPTFFLYFIIFI